MSLKAPNIIFFPHPFTDEGREEFVLEHQGRVAFVLGDRIAKGEFAVNVNGTREAIETATAGPDDSVVVRRVVQGTSSASASEQETGGKIAGWSAAAFVGGLLLTIFSQGTLASVGIQLMIAGLSGVAVGVAGYYGAWGNSSSNSSNASTIRPDISGASNSSNAKGKVPLILGKNRLTPYYAAMPFTDVSIGDDGKYKYVTMLFVLGYGPLKVSKIRMGDIDLASNSADVRSGNITVDGQYAGVQVELRQDGTLPEIYPYVVQEQQIGTTLERFHTLSFSVTINASAKTITRNDGGNWGTDDVLIGDCIEITNAGNSGNNGKWLVTNASASVITCYTVTSFINETFTASMNIFPQNVAESPKKTRKLGVTIEYKNGLCVWNNGTKENLACDIRAFYRLKGALSWTIFPEGWIGGGTKTVIPANYIWQQIINDSSSYTGKTEKESNVTRSVSFYVSATKKLPGPVLGTGSYNFYCYRHDADIPCAKINIDGVDYNETLNQHYVDVNLSLSEGNHILKYTLGANDHDKGSLIVKIVTGADASSITYPWIITRNKSETIRFYTETGMLDEGQYETMLVRYSIDHDNTTSLTYVEDCTWSDAKAYTERDVWDYNSLAKVVLMAVRIRASNQISGTVGQINAIVEGVYPAYSGSGSGSAAWTAAATTNPAAAFLWLIRGPYNPRPVTDVARFDWAALETWYTHCAGNFACNAVLTSATTAKDLLQAICEVGRASFTMKDGLFSVAEDCVKTDIKQLISPRNSWGFAWSKSFEEIPHGFKISFINEDADYAEDERIVLDDDYLYDVDGIGELVDVWGLAYAIGATNPATGNVYKLATKFESLTLAYTTDPDEVFKHARYTLAVRRLRPEAFTLNMDIEQLATTRGDRVSAAHDVVSWGKDWGRVTAAPIVDSLITSFSFDESIAFEAGVSYAFRYRTTSGIGNGTFTVAVTGEYTTITPTQAIASSTGFGVDVLVQFGTVSEGFGDCLIVGVEQSEDFSAKLTLVEYNAAIYTAETGTIPAHDSKITKGSIITTASSAASSSENQANVQAETVKPATLLVSTSTIMRSRAGVMSPVTFKAQASSYGDAYLGRFVVALSTDGSTYIDVYTSSEDESNYVYTIPALYNGSYVTNFRIRLYGSGGMTTLWGEARARVTTDSSTAAAYLGAQSSAPSSGYVVNDYYFDSTASTGGKIYYWTGSAWAEATSDWAWYGEAWAKAKLDLVAWATTTGTEVAAARAVVASLVANDAFIDELAARIIVSAALCSNGTTPRTTIDLANAIMTLYNSAKTSKMEIADGAIKAYKGSGLQRRYARLSTESLDFVDAPDTSPASAELLRGRIGRLGVGETVLIDGDFEANITSQWGDPQIINAAAVYSADYIQQSDGTLRIAYRRNSDGYIVERVYSGSAWGAESVINAAISYFPNYVQLADGTLRIAYQRNSDGYLVERIYSGSSWGAESVIDAINSSYPNYIQLSDGTLRIVYRREVDGYLIERIWSGSAWGSASVINAADSYTPDYIQQSDGTLRIAYARASDAYLVERIWSGSAWGAESVINAAGSYSPNYIEQLNGVLRIAYHRDSDGYIVERIWSGSAWGAESVINAAISYFPNYIQQSDGALRIAYIRYATDSYLIERLLPCYAKIGAGIIEEGYVEGAGYYNKYGDGTLECFGRITVIVPSGAWSEWIWTFPYAFSVAPSLYLAQGGRLDINQTTGIPSPKSSTTTSATYFNQLFGAAGAAESYAYNVYAKGRWK